MVKDMLEEIYALLKSDERLVNICIKSFERPESLQETDTSIVIKPTSTPTQMARGSNTSLSKRFTYQINVESVSRKECKELQLVIEKILEKKGFYQTAGGLEDYISHIKRYVDVRIYRGSSPLYAEY